MDSATLLHVASRSLDNRCPALCCRDYIQHIGDQPLVSRLLCQCFCRRDIVALGPVEWVKDMHLAGTSLQQSVGTVIILAPSDIHDDISGNDIDLPVKGWYLPLACVCRIYAILSLCDNLWACSVIKAVMTAGLAALLAEQRGNGWIQGMLHLPLEGLAFNLVNGLAGSLADLLDDDLSLLLQRGLPDGSLTELFPQRSESLKLRLGFFLCGKLGWPHQRHRIPLLANRLNNPVLAVFNSGDILWHLWPALHYLKPFQHGVNRC